MQGQRRREQGVSAPGSIDQENKSGPREAEKASQETQSEKQIVRSFTKDYAENLDIALKVSGYDDATQKELRDLFTQDELKSEVILRAAQTNPENRDLKSFLQAVLENKDSIADKYTEKQKALRSNKGKQVYWTSQKAKEVAKNGDSSIKAKQIQDRIRQLEKQERTLRANKIDLKTPLILKPIRETREEDLEELPESAIIQLPSETEAAHIQQPSAYEAPLIQRDANVEQMENLERKANVAGVEMEVKMVGDSYVIEFPKNKIKIDVGSDRKTAEALFNFAMQEAGHAINKNGFDHLVDKVSLLATREKNLKEQYAKQKLDDEEAERNESQAINETSVPATPTRFPDGMPRFADFVTDDDAKLKHKIETVASMAGYDVSEKAPLSVEDRAMEIMFEKAERKEPFSYLQAIEQAKSEMPEAEPPVAEILAAKRTIDRRSPSPAAEQTVDVAPEPTFAQPPRSETEWWHQTGANQFYGAWDAMNQEMGPGATESTLISFGVPKAILDKFQTPQALYQFVENPGFWAKINGDAYATREAINKLIEEVNITRQGSVANDTLAQQGRRERVTGKETQQGVGQGITLPEIHIPFSRGVEDLPVEDQQRIELAGRPPSASDTAIIPRLGEQTIRIETQPSPEIKNQQEAREFLSTWNALGADEAKRTLLSLGLPEGILKKYKSANAIYQFAENPGFMASIFGGADATIKAINLFLETKSSTQDSAKIVSDQAQKARARTEQSYQQTPTTSSNERRI